MAKVKSWPIHIFIMLNTPTNLTEMPSISIGLNNIYFETIEKQYKYYTNLSCHGLCLLAVWPGKEGGEGRLKVEG